MARAPFAADPARSRGREFAVADDGARGPRTAFQRDRDRIIHAIAFRRLAGKTQVFIAPDGDHFRVRLTHSLEVAQIGRVIARSLGLDEDLTEALCLAHDIGHPPFGHSGEDALDAALGGHGGFDHNEHALRVLMRLDSPYCGHPGLNLSWELLEGLAKHNGPVAAPGWALAELDAAFPLELAAHPSLEAQVAALADDIAYDNHDIDDGLRSGFLALDDLLGLDFVAEQWRSVEQRFPRADPPARLRELVRGQIGLMVNDAIDTTRAGLGGIGTLEDVRAAGRAVARFSPAMAQRERRLKAFLYERLYHHPVQRETAGKAQAVIARLFAAYAQDPALLPPGWRERLPASDPARARHIADFIAGMTDRYAMDQHARILGEVPEGLSHVSLGKDRPPMKRHAPAAARNREPIAAVLASELPASGLVLEIASGTGEHAVHFARAFWQLTWQPSDPDPDALASIAAWREAEIAAGAGGNLLPPLRLDVRGGAWPTEPLAAIFCINMVHISPREATEALFEAAGRLLPPDAPLVLYGPFLEQEVPTAASNLAFDESLRARDPRWGLRRVEWLDQLGEASGLGRTRRVVMPANNLTLVYRRNA